MEYYFSVYRVFLGLNFLPFHLIYFIAGNIDSSYLADVFDVSIGLSAACDGATFWSTRARICRATDGLPHS